MMQKAERPIKEQPDFSYSNMRSFFVFTGIYSEALLLAKRSQLALQVIVQILEKL